MPKYGKKIKESQDIGQDGDYADLCYGPCDDGCEGCNACEDCTSCMCYFCTRAKCETRRFFSEESSGYYGQGDKIRFAMGRPEHLRKKLKKEGRIA